MNKTQLSLTELEKYELPWVLVEAHGKQWYQIFDCIYDAIKFVRRSKYFKVVKIKGMHQDVSRGSSR